MDPSGRSRVKKKLALVKNVRLNGHRIDGENFKVLTIESNYKKTVFRIIVHTQNRFCIKE